MAAAAGRARAVVTLPTDMQILIIRELDAPRHLVYRAWTEPEFIRRWWSARRGKVTLAEVDLRVGGQWRWVMMADRGFEVGFHGEYREIVPNERLVYTEEFEGMPGAPALVTTTFTESPGGTVLTLLVEHSSRSHRDAHVNSGMEEGLQDALDLLEEAVRGL